MIGVLDYGMGNLMSVRNSLENLFFESKVISSPDDFSDITHLIIPGVGAFPEAIRNIKEQGYLTPIRQFANEGKPLLGICLGMQLLANGGDEVTQTEGLGLINGWIKKMKPDGLSVPHIGWNELRFIQDHPIFEGVKKTSDVYFVHSFYFDAYDNSNIVTTTDYGFDFVSVVKNDRGNVVGTQFHPEKSQKQGLRILENFAKMKPC